MSKQPKWKIWPKELYETFIAIGICSALIGIVLPIVSMEVDNRKIAGMLYLAGVFFATGGAIIVVIATIGLALEHFLRR